jgi:hypothetical protein
MKLASAGCSKYLSSPKPMSVVLRFDLFPLVRPYFRAIAPILLETSGPAMGWKLRLALAFGF